MASNGLKLMNDQLINNIVGGTDRSGSLRNLQERISRSDYLRHSWFEQWSSNARRESSVGLLASTHVSLEKKAKPYCSKNWQDKKEKRRGLVAKRSPRFFSGNHPNGESGKSSDEGGGEYAWHQPPDAKLHVTSRAHH